MSRTIKILLAGVFCALTLTAVADTLTFSGTITQSTQDGTGPAANNTSLNNILTGDTFRVTLVFTGSINGPGTYDLTGSTLTFSDPAASASETAFNSISLTLTDSGTYDISLLACLTTGTDCSYGNQLDANFSIANADLHSTGTAISLDQPHPFDLLEDDGVTDIHGSIGQYGYSGAVTSVPEPSTLPLLASGGLLFVTRARRRFIRAARRQQG